MSARLIPLTNKPIAARNNKAKKSPLPTGGLHMGRLVAVLVLLSLLTTLVVGIGVVLRKMDAYEEAERREKEDRFYARPEDPPVAEQEVAKRGVKGRERAEASR